MFTVILKKQLLSFSLGTDDDDRVVLKSISDGVDCEHDYINATYIDVRPFGIYTWLLKRVQDGFTYLTDVNWLR